MAQTDIGPRILVAGCPAKIAASIRSALTEIALVNIIEVADGQSALHSLEGEYIELLILAWSMPKVSGLEILRMVREQPRWCDIPVLLLLNKQESSLGIAAAKLHKADFTTIPLSPKILRSKVQNLIAATNRSAPRTVRILIVDDLSTARRIIQKLLCSLGFTNTSEAQDGEEAFSMIQEGDYDIVISDLEMPRLSGIELLRKIRCQPGREQLPFILVAANTHKDQVVAAREAGANGYLMKPFDSATLKEVFDRILLKGSSGARA